MLLADGTWENIINIKSGDVIESYNVKTNKEYPNVVIDVPVEVDVVVKGGVVVIGGVVYAYVNMSPPPPTPPSPGGPKL